MHFADIQSVRATVNNFNFIWDLQH